MPNQMMKRLKYASGGSARTNVTTGSATTRSQLTVPSSTPISRPPATPIAEPMRIRRRLTPRCSMSRWPLYPRTPSWTVDVTIS